MPVNLHNSPPDVLQWQIHLNDEICEIFEKKLHFLLLKSVKPKNWTFPNLCWFNIKILMLQGLDGFILTLTYSLLVSNAIYSDTQVYQELVLCLKQRSRNVWSNVEGTGPRAKKSLMSGAQTILVDHLWENFSSHFAKFCSDCIQMPGSVTSVCIRTPQKRFKSSCHFSFGRALLWLFVQFLHLASLCCANW